MAVSRWGRCGEGEGDTESILFGEPASRKGARAAAAVKPRCLVSTFPHAEKISAAQETFPYRVRLMISPFPDVQESDTVIDWDRIVREYGPLVFATAWRILGHAADTEDVVQEVFLQVHQLQRTHVVRHWPALLRRLAACRALDRLRQRKNTVSLNGLCLAASDDGPEELAVERELSERLRLALAQLPAREAAVFCLRYFDDLSYQEIAEALHIRAGAVASALHKARLKLETLLLETVKENP
jgi:RNA polymerase sigma-70 factor (ECF subfamily)